MNNYQAERAIFEEVLAERQRQDERWGGPAHDDTLCADEWTNLLFETTWEAAHACELNIQEIAVSRYRQALVKIAALAMAAIAACDRHAFKGGPPLIPGGRHE